MMPRTLTLLLLALIPVVIPSCGTGRVDVRNPTVVQMDAQDVAWGLEARKPKGGAKRLMPTPESLNLPPSTPEAAAAGATPAPTTAPTPPPSSPDVNAGTINNLQ